MAFSILQNGIWDFFLACDLLTLMLSLELGVKEFACLLTYTSREACLELSG